jgi:hypothetical protein
MFDAQHGLCAICRKPPKGGSRTRVLHVDHCHETNTVRGLLCTTCNSGLGALGDNEAGLLRALHYLHRARVVQHVPKTKRRLLRRINPAYGSVESMGASMGRIGETTNKLMISTPRRGWLLRI